MTSEPVALVPAKKFSRRVPNKNFREFYCGLSLTEIKVIRVKQAGYRKIVISSDCAEAEAIARKHGVNFDFRPEWLCLDNVILRDLFSHCLREFRASQVYWAHPTSPFVSATTIKSATALSDANPNSCVLGVFGFQEFLWDNNGPLNYDEANQPRSQDLPKLYRITGGIHMAKGEKFVASGAVSFRPAKFTELSLVESIDINTQEEWELARQLAPLHIQLP